MAQPEDDLMGFGMEPPSSLKSSSSGPGPSSEKYSARDLEKDLEGWREVLLRLTRFFTWEQPWYPAAIAAIVSLKFLVIWYMDLSALTLVSLVALKLVLLDYLVPVASDQYFGRDQWTGDKEKQFQLVCAKLFKVRAYAANSVDALRLLKRDKPKIYFVVMVVSMTLLAWIGYSINNTLLSYFLVLFIALLPGLRHHGIIQKHLGAVTSHICSYIGSSKAKTK